MGKLVVATLHKQAEEALIALMKNTSDNKLVSEEDLAAMLGVSRTTVREAMNSLMRRGALTKRKGKGNFFLKSVMDTHMRIDYLHDFSIVLREAGYSPALISKKMGNTSPSSDLQRKLNCTADDRILYIRWTYLADESQAIIIDTWIPERLFITPLPDEYTIRGEAISKSDIFKTLCDQDLSHYISSFKTAHNPEVCRKFGISDDTALPFIEQHTYNIRDQCIAYAHLYFNPDIMELNIVTKIP
jgi:GntR family transcriptional regulator